MYFKQIKFGIEWNAACMKKIICISSAPILKNLRAKTWIFNFIFYTGTETVARTESNAYDLNCEECLTRLCRSNCMSIVLPLSITIYQWLTLIL